MDHKHGNPIPLGRGDNIESMMLEGVGEGVQSAPPPLYESLVNVYPSTFPINAVIGGAE